MNHNLADVGPDSPNPYVKQGKEERDPPDEKEQEKINSADKK